MTKVRRELGVDELHGLALRALGRMGIRAPKVKQVMTVSEAFRRVASAHGAAVARKGVSLFGTRAIRSTASMTSEAMANAILRKNKGPTFPRRRRLFQR